MHDTMVAQHLSNFLPKPRPPLEWYHNNKSESVLSGMKFAEVFLNDACSFAPGLDSALK